MTVEEIRRIAEQATENINKITSLVSNYSTLPVGTAINELQRRFPTINSSGMSSCVDPRPYHPYRSTASRVGCPVKSSIVTRDVIIIEKGREHMPSKAKKVEMERNGRVVTGFDLDRSWNAKELHKELKYFLKDTEMDDLRFEIVKNCAGTVMFPNIPNGKIIDAALLLKSISST